MKKFFQEHWKIMLIALVSLVIGFLLNYISNCITNDKLLENIKAEIRSIKNTQINNKNQTL